MQKLLQLVNDYRKANGVGELSWSNALESAAKTRAAEISKVSDAENESHIRPDGSAWYTINPDIMWAENIAYGQSSAEAVFEAWKNSAGHRTNMLNGDYKTMGAAVYVEEGTTYTYYWIQEFGY